MKPITRNINSQYIPTITSGYPIFRCGGKMYANGGSMDEYGLGGFFKKNWSAALSPAIGIGSLLSGKNANEFAKENAGAIGTGVGAAAGTLIGNPMLGAQIGGQIGGQVQGNYEQKMQQEQQQDAMLDKQRRDLSSNLPAQPDYVPTFADGGNTGDKRPSRGFTGWSRDVSHKMGVPLAVNQLLYDLKGRDGAITEKSLNKEELARLKEIVRGNLAKGKNVIEYADYGTGTNPYADVGGNSKNSDIISKMFDPSYNLKTTLGQASISVTPTDTIVSDQYNFNNKIDDATLKDYLQSVPQQGGSIYGQFRNVGKYFGSGPGEGSEVDIRFADGGYTKAYGGNIDNTTDFPVGGTHEANPNGGIPIGNKGMVEQDEVKFDLGNGESYIFSNRIPYKKK